MTPESLTPSSPPPSAPLYPPSPKESAAPLDTSTAYRVRVVLVLLSLLLFLAIYLGLAAASGWLVYWSFQAPLTGRRGSFSFFNILLMVASAMLFTFFVKGLFKRSKRDMDKLIEVKEKEQPELFAFVRRLCQDAGAPLPKAIFLTHEVNAAVFYPRSLLSLLLPVRKNLLIGVGLVNLLNISELKAVLAHEFGHFAQSSMKLGQYVYIANQAIRDMAFARDSWDEWLAKWRSIDLRLSFPAWIITGVVYVLRFVLKQIFRVVNIANLSLSRQMEFNADLNAVRLTGSDALISGLWKTERGSLAMQRAFNVLYSMSEHGKYSDDLFYHQKSELSRIDGLLDKQEEQTAFIRSLREPYSYGQAVHFREGEGQATSMWASHPPNRDREINAKKRYIELAPVTTSAWKLLEGRKGLKKKLTLMAYDDILTRRVSAKDLLPAEEIQKLAREDEDEREQAPHYHGLYENRAVELGDIDKLILSLDAEGAPDDDELRKKAAAWTGDKLASFMGKYNKVVTNVDSLAAYINAHARGDAPKTFEHDGEKITIREAKPLYEEANEEAEKLRKRLKTADRTLFRHFYRRARASAETREDLERRYRFLLAVQELILKLKDREGTAVALVRQLSANKELTAETFRSFVAALESCHGELTRTREATKKLRMPRLTHLEEGALVASFVFPDGVIDSMPDPTKIEGPWLMSLLRQIGQSLGRLRKLHFKNLGVLLKLQEDLDPDLYATTSGGKVGTDVLNMKTDDRDP